MKIKTKKSFSLVIVLTVVGVAAVGVGSMAVAGIGPFKRGQARIDTAQSSADNQAQIDQKKETFADKEETAANTAKDNTADQTKESTATTKASVIVTYAGQSDDGLVEVNAYIPDYYKDGTCTLTFTKNDAHVVKSTPAYRDATTTICTNSLIKRAEFSQAGIWSLVVSYSADGGSGASAAQNIEVR